MTMEPVDVYLSFAESVTDDQRDEFLTKLEASLSSSMEMTKGNGQDCVHFAHADPDAAVIAVQARAQPILEAHGLDDQQVTGHANQGRPSSYGVLAMHCPRAWSYQIGSAPLVRSGPIEASCEAGWPSPRSIRYTQSQIC
jgi:hypothetical protein